jgi:HlyD family secretion protein
MDTPTNLRSADVERTLSEIEPASAPPWRKALPWLLGALAVLVVAYLWLGRANTGAVNYVTQPVTGGSLTVTVTATGNLEPVNQVDIGSELSGTVRLVNVDFNDEVKKGQVLATLDTQRLKAQVLQSQSALASAQARVRQAAAAAKEARANYQRLLKVRELSGNKLPSQQDLDVSEATVANADGEHAAAEAAVAQERAGLVSVQTDLSKADIRSPIDGVVLVRSVEPGQTVAASLQAPVLFTLAEDLKKMELHVLVDEADVGSVEVGQQATFSVDAFPNRTFSARITQVHFASNNTQKSSSSSSSSSQSSATSTGVVTYETVLEVDNSELLLRPGMTATAEIVTTKIDNALLVPNAALRFTPEGANLPGQQPSANQQRGPLSALMPQFPRRPANNNQRDSSRRFGRVWVLEDKKPVLVMFKPGATDGRNTQVLPADGTSDANRGPARANDEMIKQALARKLEVGMPVIVDSESKVKAP